MKTIWEVLPYKKKEGIQVMEVLLFLYGFSVSSHLIGRCTERSTQKYLFSPSA
jgi:hypothetical protein